MYYNRCVINMLHKYGILMTKKSYTPPKILENKNVIGEAAASPISMNPISIAPSPGPAPAPSPGPIVMGPVSPYTSY